MASLEPDLSGQLQIHHGSPQVIGTPLTYQQTLQLLTNKLLPLLPYTVTLARRIQFDLRHPSPTAQVYIATIPPTPISSPSEALSTLTTWLSAPFPTPPPPAHPFLATYIDLIPAGQTQVFTFASWEIPADHSPPFRFNPTPPPPNPILSPPSNPTHNPLHASLIRTLLTHLTTHLIPLRPTSPPADWLWLRDNKKYLSQPYSTHKVLFGALHSSLVPLISLGGTTRRDGRYWKLVFPPPPPSPSPDAVTASVGSPRSLPEGYTEGVLTDAELHTVLDRSPIPRTIGTLRSLVNVGIYHHQHQRQQTPGNETQRECIGWGFLSKDGSISSVYVEEPHRGQGLAVYLTERLLGKMAGAFGALSEEGEGDEGEDEGSWWGHVDVEENNTASRRAMQKLGAEPWFGVQWVEIDVGRVLEEVKGRS